MLFEKLKYLKERQLSDRMLGHRAAVNDDQGASAQMQRVGVLRRIAEGMNTGLYEAFECYYQGFARTDKEPQATVSIDANDAKHPDHSISDTIIASGLAIIIAPYPLAVLTHEWEFVLVSPIGVFPLTFGLIARSLEDKESS